MELSVLSAGPLCRETRSWRARQDYTERKPITSH